MCFIFKHIARQRNFNQGPSVHREVTIMIERPAIFHGASCNKSGRLCSAEFIAATTAAPWRYWTRSSQWMRLLLVLECEKSADRPLPDLGEPWECLGRGSAHHRRRRLRHRLSAMIRGQRKVYLYPRRINLEKLRNKHLANSYSCLFIKQVLFVFDLTSYVYKSYFIHHFTIINWSFIFTLRQ